MPFSGTMELFNLLHLYTYSSFAFGGLDVYEYLYTHVMEIRI